MSDSDYVSFAEEVVSARFTIYDPRVVTVASPSSLHTWDAHELAVRIHTLINSRPSSPIVEEIEALLNGGA